MKAKGWFFVFCICLIILLVVFYSSQSHISQAQAKATLQLTGNEDIQTLKKVFKTGRFRCSYPPLKKKSELPPVGHVCILIRSDGSLFDPDYSLPTLYDCLDNLEYPDWSAFVFTTDEESVPLLHLLGKTRKYPERYHSFQVPFRVPDSCPGDCGFNITDYAIYSLCPRRTAWLLITQGDNEYSPYFLSYLDPNFDGFGTWWFSGSQSTPLPRSIISPKWEKTNCSGAPYHAACKINDLNPGKNNLGAMVLNYKKFISEKRRFSKYSPNCCHGGLMVQEMEKDGWDFEDVEECLFSHSSNQWTDCHRTNYPRFQN